MRFLPRLSRQSGQECLEKKSHIMRIWFKSQWGTILTSSQFQITASKKSISCSTWSHSTTLKLTSTLAQANWQQSWRRIASREFHMESKLLSCAPTSKWLCISGSRKYPNLRQRDQETNQFKSAVSERKTTLLSRSSGMIKNSLQWSSGLTHSSTCLTFNTYAILS